MYIQNYFINLIISILFKSIKKTRMLIYNNLELKLIILVFCKILIENFNIIGNEINILFQWS